MLKNDIHLYILSLHNIPARKKTIIEVQKRDIENKKEIR